MKHLALGWACNLNDIFVRFPYEKCKNLIKRYRNKHELKKLVKRVFRTGMEMIISDMIENNITFQFPGFQYYDGEMHFEAVKGSLFEEQRAKGKFSGIDFLETLFTGYLLYLYISGKSDNLLARKKVPVYISNNYKSRLEDLVNNGKTYG